MKDWMILFMVFVVLFIALIPTTAFAEETNRVYDKTGNDAPINVYGKYVENTDRPVYSINISWGNMEFTYTEGSKGTWNPTTHSYDNPILAGWTCSEGENVIKIENHSNTDISISFKYTNILTTDKQPQATFSKNDIRLETAENKTVENTPTETVSLELSGDIDSTIADNQIIGTISITIN